MKSLILHLPLKWLRLWLGLCSLAVLLSLPDAGASQLTLADSPLFLANTAKPIMMLNVSKDAQIYLKAYDDFSDLNGDGIPDITYNDSINYYGYFDSFKCYTYNTSTFRFEPTSVIAPATLVNHYCTAGSNLWSGNFLNWSTMTRIDTIRKILYGGLRSTDTGTAKTPDAAHATTTSNVVKNFGQAQTTTVPPSLYGSVAVAVATTITNVSVTTVTDTTTTPKGGGQSSTTETSSTTTSSSTAAAAPVTTYSGKCSATNDCSKLQSTGVTTQSTAETKTNTTSVTNPSNIVATTISSSSFVNTLNSVAYTNDGGTSKTSAPQTSGPTINTQVSTNRVSSRVNQTITTTTTTTKVTTIQTNTTNYYSGTSSTTTPETDVTTTVVTTPLVTTNANTVLERSFLPHDAHSFAKYYNGSDIPKLTPFSATQVSGSNVANNTGNFTNTAYSGGITICNTTASSNSGNFSQNVTDPPLIRIAKGNNSLWAANERWQCRWIEEVSATTNSYNGANNNGNISTTSGLLAYSINPSKTSFGSGVQTEFNARVQVCVSGLVNTETCKTYTNTTTGLNNGLTSLKPIGLLQTYGDNDQIYYGLMTGSYRKNKSGGVLRKNVSSISNEVNVNIDGTFNAAPSTTQPAPSNGGIINTLNLLRLYGYYYSVGTYLDGSHSDNCAWGIGLFNDGQCSNWGNPQSELFLESLRYLANNTAAFSTDDTTYIPGLQTAVTNYSAGNAASSIIPNNQWCAKLSVMEFNASSSSYDGDQLSGVSDIGVTGSISTLTDIIGNNEGISGKNFFVGSNGTLSDGLCTGKTVKTLSGVSGTCPDAPRLSGTYQIAGLANYAHTTDIAPSVTGNQTPTIYGVALAPQQPVITVPVPFTSNQTVTIIPACQNTSISNGPGACTLVDFKIVNQSSTDCSMLTNPPTPAGKWTCGKVYINWEDSEQGGDYDMDMWGTLTYQVSSTQLVITTQAIYKSTPYALGLGYVLGGTTKDGYHAHSGINSYVYNDATPGTGTGTGAITGTGSGTMTHCGTTSNDCVDGANATTVTYSLSSSSGSASTAASLQQPLWYASKWGGFNNYTNIIAGTTIPTIAEWDADKNGIPDLYFYATNPSTLATSVAKAFNAVIATNASASAAAANSTSLQVGTTVLYQAQFNSADWSGHFFEFPVQSDGTIKDVNGDGILNAVDATWDAATLIPAPANRNIWTYNPSGGANGGGLGVPFLWPTASASSLSTAQTTALNTSLSGSVDTNGQLRLNWLRGDTSDEIRFANGIFRNRTTTVLGDIINSDPIYSQNEDFGYSKLPVSAPEQAGYAAYLTSKKTRLAMIYDGANDGMLHGFSATSGVEQFAYIPNAVFANLSSLTDPAYVHKYYVDGSPSIGDAYLAEGWTTVLVGGLNKGGKAIYALSIDDPASFDTDDVLWEYSGAASTTDTSGVNDNDGMGLTYSQPQVARMNDGTWAAIFGNGYNSVSGQAFLYIVNLNTGVLIKKIATSAKITSNGLSTAALYDTDGNQTIDAVYAGDLQGNLWKFDLSGSTSASWGLANGGLPLFTATNSSNQVQPITAQPTVAAYKNGGALVFFGTGEYLSNADVTDTTVQSFYAIWDNLSVGTVTRSQLVQQTINQTVVSGTTNPNAQCQTGSTCTTTYTENLRGVSTNPVNLTSASTTQRGWYIDFTPISGERVVSAAFVKYGRIIFLTLIPSTDACVPGGTSWLMELDTGSGTAVIPAFDLNNDGKFNSSDSLPNKANAAGMQSTVGIVKSAVWLDTQNSNVAHKELSGSTSNFQTVANQGGTTTATSVGTPARRYWLQLQ